MGDNSPAIKSSISLPRRRIKAITTRLLRHHPIHGHPVSRALPQGLRPLRVVCISDTHNTQPILPPGDILVHSGDLTENGSFDELEAQLTWLNAQPHPHKVLIAGNHDVLLDDAFLARYPARRYGDSRSKEDLPLGAPLKYLKDSSTSIMIAGHGEGGDTRIRVYGSPWTPAYGISAFQHPRDEDPWEDAVPDGTDVLLTHGPPRGHLDRRDFHDAGCSYLAAEVFRVRPRLHVFGHIHAARGREDVVLDRARQIHDEVYAGWAGWSSVLLLAADVLVSNIQCLFLGRKRMLARERVTTFVNAAVVGGPPNEMVHEAIVVEL